VKSTTTALDEVWIVKTWLDLKLETHVVGTTTGDDQLVGTAIVAGTETQLLVATETTTEVETVMAALDGSDDGTFDHEITAKPGVGKMMTDDEATEVGTAEIGTKTGDEKVDGRVMVAGKVT